MIEYENITLRQLIASYMDKFQTTSISFIELKRWANYIKKYFKDKNLEVVPLLNKEDVVNFESDDMFYKSEKMFCLNKDKTLKDVYDFCGTMSQKLLLMLVFNTDNFVSKTTKENTL